MSLSRIFKGQDGFKPEKLVKVPSDAQGQWEQASLTRPLPPNPPADQSPEQNLRQQGNGYPEEQETEVPPVNNGIADTTNSQGMNSNGHIDVPAAAAEPPPPAPPPPDLDKIREEAFSLGVQEGYKQAEADFGSGLSALTLVCDQLNTIRETILKNSKSEIIDLIISLSEKIIRHSVTEQNQTIIDTVEEALSQAIRSSEFYIYLNPEDFEIIKNREEDFISGVNGLENIIIKTATDIERGGCRIESENCTVDATLASQLSIIQEEVKKQG